MGKPDGSEMVFGQIPDWVPVSAQRYILHTEFGFSIRALARWSGCHASTILRQVRKFENRRDDPLIDQALACLGRRQLSKSPSRNKETRSMNIQIRSGKAALSDETLNREACRILRRLSESGSVLAVAAEMEKAVVVRELPSGKSTRTAVVDREIAQAMALKDWISCKKSGRITRYEISSVGRSALKRLLAAQGRGSRTDGVCAQGFAEQHRDWRVKPVMEEKGQTARNLRFNVAESPLTALARRKDKNGKPFLSDDLVAAGERLREDFETAHMGPRVAQNWEKFLTAGKRGSFSNAGGPAEGPTAARNRVRAALQDLGPGLGDVVLRCCCFLEGMETAEKRMGWSARSGKIVLRIALQRLRRHYDETYGPHGPMIG